MRSTNGQQEREGLQRVSTFGSLLVSECAIPHPMKKRTHSQTTISALTLTKEQRQQHGERLRSVVSSTPVGTHGSEWLCAISSAISPAMSARGSIGNAASTSAASTSMQTLVQVPLEASRLPAVASAPSLVPHTSKPAEQRRARDSKDSLASSHANDHPAPKRFGAGQSENLFILTPRTLLNHEERLLAYLAAQDHDMSASKAHVPIPEGGVQASILSNASLREIWNVTATTSHLEVSPRRTAIPQDVLEPINEEDALTVLRDVPALSSFGDEDLLRLLRVGSRKILPKYAIPMRIGVVASSNFFIVLRGRYDIQPSILEIQAHARAHSDAGASKGAKKGRSDLSRVVGPSAIFGELSLLHNVPCERTVMTLEAGEVLSVSSEALQRLGSPMARRVCRSLQTSFNANALRSVPFFNGLPAATHRQVADLLGIECFAAGDFICRQGDVGDKMYIVLWGAVEVWRSKRRGWDREMIAKYSGKSALPWFGEVFQWIKGHGRAGDVICTDDAVTLSLHRDRLADFIFFAPGFKALSMSAASTFTVKSVRATKAEAGMMKNKGHGSTTESGDRPLRFAMQWARIISKLLNAGSMASVASVKVQQLRRKKVNSMDWVADMVEQVENVPSFQEEEAGQGVSMYDEEQRKMLARAHSTQHGESRSLAAIANGRGWRAENVLWNVRAETLRESAASGFLAFELDEKRKAISHKREVLPESFPPSPVRKEDKPSRINTLFRDA